MEKKILILKIFFNVFLLFHNMYYLLLEKGSGSSFEQTWIPVIKGSFVSSFVEIVLVVLE